MYPKISIAGQTFTRGIPCLVAEAGISHCGRVEFLEELVIGAAVAGAHAIKTQFRLEDEWHIGLMPHSLLQTFQETLLTPDDHLTVRALARKLGLIYGTTVFCEKALDFMAELEPDYLKVGSGESMHFDFVRKVVSKANEMSIPSVISTGMLDEDEKEVLCESYPDSIIMSCVSAYPAMHVAPVMDVKYPGYSDHAPCGEQRRVSFDDVVMLERHIVHPESDVDATAGDSPEQLLRYFSGDHSLRSTFEPTWIADQDYEPGDRIETEMWKRCGFGVRVTEPLYCARVKIEAGQPILYCMNGP